MSFAPLRARGLRRFAHRPFHPTQARARRIFAAIGQALLALTLLLQPVLARPAMAQEPPIDPTDPAAGQADVSVTWDVVPAADPAPPPITITEIYAKPPLDTDRHEFVELYNPTNKPVSLAFWTLGGAVDYSFPGGAVIAAQGYVVVAENPAAFRARYGTAAALVYGPFDGHFAVEGEEIVLRNDITTRVDSVAYGYGFPWPVAGALDGQSIQLINPSLDNAVAGTWRAGAATPASANAGSVSNPPPFVQSIAHEPRQPKPGEGVSVSAVVTDADGIGAVTVAYQVVQPGAYITIGDAAYNTAWTTAPMAAAGPVEGGLLYKAQLPPLASRTLVRYRVQVADGGGRTVALPYPEDPQPNFAYFVYGAPSAWWGSLRPGEGVTNFNFATMRALPVYFFIGKQSDVTDAMHMPPSQQPPYMGNDYKWRGTFVYNGEVYDHVGFRPTGADRRYATGKTNWRFDFLSGHRFQAYDDFGRPYAVKRDNINLRGEIGHTDRERRGEAGMFESMSYRLFNLAGVPASDTNFVHYRVITGADEYGGSQYNGDFWGLYLSIENPDEQFLEEHNLPDGNLYKIESTAPPPAVNYFEGDLNNLGRNGPADKSDLNALAYYSQAGTPATWWRTNVDLENYYSFRAIVEFVHHYDMGEGKNYMFYRNPESSKWAIYPWDLDLTWHDTSRYFGTGQEPWACSALRRCYDPLTESFSAYGGPFAIEYQGRLHECRDLLLNPEQLFPMLDEQAGLIDTPASDKNNARSLVAADRFKWDYNPIYSATWGNPQAPSKYVDTEKSAPGQFYKCAIGKGSDGSCSSAGTFRGMVEGMKAYANQRFGWIDAYLINDAAIPATPTIANAGSTAADQIRFATGPFSDPQGAGTFAAMEWRLADITDGATPRAYEINAVWESGVLPIYQNTVEPPAGVVQPGRAYRARVRMMDNTGRWSHWSPPLQFAAAAPATPVVQDLLLTEIMYNPLPWGNTPGDELEFIELTNKSNRTVPLGGLHMRGGIDYTFPPNSVVGPNKTIILAKDARAFARRYGFNPFGAYDRKLSNGGDTIELVDGWGRSLLKVEYSDSAPWPLDADGKGYSLVYSPALGAPTNGASWRRSLSIGGSPGGPEPVSIVINEFQLNPPLQRAVELYNPGETAVDVSRWFLSDSTADPRKVWLPANSLIPPRGFLVVNYGLLNQPSFDGRLELDPPVTGQLVLSAGNAAGVLTGYQMRVSFPALEPGVTYGRILDSLGRAAWVLLARPTLGGENSGPRLGPLVISAINYAPVGNAPEYIELTNTSGRTVELFDRNAPAQSWKIVGGFMNIPAGLTLRANERLLAVSVPPEQACQTLGNRGFVRIVGPFTPQLSDSGQTLSLLQPPAAGSSAAWSTNDSARYAASAPWPVQAAGQGAALRRVNLAGYGSDPVSWQPSADLPGVEAASSATTLCSFTAIANFQGKIVLTWALAGAPLAAAVTGFKLFRGPDLDPAHAVPVASVSVADGVAASANAPVATFTTTDPTANPNAPAYYWLRSVGAGGALTDMGQTSIQWPYQFVFMPTVKR